MTLRKPAIAVLVFALCAGMWFMLRKSDRVFMSTIGCSLLDAQGKEIKKKYLGWVCAFFPNGKMILGDGFTLTFYDKNMDVVWSRDVHTHHSIMFSPEDNTALVLASNILGKNTRIDRLEVYDQDGRRLKHFDFKPEHSIQRVPFTWDQFVFPRSVRWQLTHINSFYRIGKNRSKHPAFAEGNYIVNEAMGRIYFFDKDLKNIVHSIDISKWNRHLMTDVQVTKNGTILFYSGKNVLQNDPHTSLVEVDPEDGRVLWSYRGNPEFHAPYEGNVQILENGNILFSTVDIPYTEFPTEMMRGKHRMTEITREGKIVWSVSRSGENLSGLPNVAKLWDMTSYLKNKGTY